RITLIALILVIVTSACILTSFVEESTPEIEITVPVAADEQDVTLAQPAEEVEKESPPPSAQDQTKPAVPLAQQPMSTPLPTAAARAGAAESADGAEAESSAIYPAPTAPPPQNNYFEDYGVNPFVDTYEDHLSTFALDVDTASYSVARRYVNDGHIPPAEAVRVEEFVNYFDMDYPTPSNVAFGIYADGAASPFHNDGSYILRFGVQGYEIPAQARKAATLTFVIDVSGSMAMENRLGLVKDSLQMLVDRLRPDDTVAIVVYGSNARTVLTPTSGENKNTILNAIYALRTEGATNAEAGLRMGYELAYEAHRPNTINRVILCSDGVANVGNTGPEAILETIRGYVETGISLTTVGFGMGNFNDVLMEQLADNGNGHYAYVDSVDEAEKLFVQNLTSTLQTIALDAKIQIDFNSDVVAYYRLIGYENRDVADQDFRNDSVDAGEIGAGHSVTALYAVTLRPGAAGRIATAQLRWEDPQSHQVTEINGNFNTWDLASGFGQSAARYQLAVVAAQYAEILRQSPWAGETSLYQLADYIYSISAALPSDADVAEFANLVNRASQLQGWGQ
ncbi:MAG: von Willebrand factor type A domain-containing protein, partial [Chloroflexota bacterium]|nr:von Willebrand factor type A domain-containing protein [Chloroflexota bacterium]